MSVKHPNINKMTAIVQVIDFTWLGRLFRENKGISKVYIPSVVTKLMKPKSTLKKVPTILHKAYKTQIALNEAP